MGIKNFIKKSISFVSAAAMALTMVAMPVGSSSSYAEETGSTTTDPNPNLILDKSAKLQSDGTYTITLEAYAKGRVETTPAVIKPCDIVLVLDQSGSMDFSFSGSQSRQKALQDAATKFVENVSKNAREKKVDHKISIVSFATDSSIVKENVSLYNETNPNQNTIGEQTLKNAINGLNANGSTRVDLGMENANKLIQKDSTRNKVVVVFTDGYPTKDYDKFTISVADSAINYAKNLKTKNAKVYTIGIFNGADVNQVSGTTSDAVGQYWEIGNGDTSAGKNAAANRFLNYMSSNFSDASSLGLKTAKYKINYWDYWGTDCYEITTKFDSSNSKYYMTASNQTELSNIFEKISDEVSEGKTDVILDETAVAKDIMSENFNLPNDVTNNVKVYTEEYNGKDASNNPKWQNRQPLTNADVSYNTGEKSISVSGFSYKDNYIVDGQGSVETSGKKLIIVITDVTAKNAGMNMYTNNSNSAIYDGEGGKVKEFPMPQESIDSTSYVLDYGKTVTTAASDYGVSAVTIANADEPSPYNVKLQGTYGTFAKNHGNLDYTPGKINWDGIDRGYVFGAKDENTIAAETTEEKNSKNYSAYKWEEVNFMPASSVYYEDDFAQTTNSTDSNVKIIWTGDWKEQGKSKDNNQSSENIQYGWDNIYDNETGYSNGSTHAAYTKGATATFTFTGTGVDIYSRTDGVVGKVYAKLTGSSKANKDITINKGLNVNNKSDSGTYYQIPTLSFDNLEYGTYTVKLTVLGNSTSENKEDGTAAYYLDGIRVYNPLGQVNDLNTTEGKAYDKAGELNAKYIKVRDILIDAKTLKGDTFDTIKYDVSGTVFIDRIENDKGTTTDKIGTFKDLGPKNEVYLKNGQGIVFNVKDYDSNANLFIGLKAMSGTATTVEVTNGTERTTKNINSANDLYYSITPDEHGNVVIKNTGAGLLSITKVRITTKSSSANTYSLRITPDAMSYAKTFDSLPLTTDNKTEDKNDEDTTLGKDDVEIENPSEDKNNDNNQSNNNNNFWNNVVNNFRKWFRR